MSKISILALASSPEKGQNSDTLLDAFLEGVKEKNPDAVIDKYYISEIPLKAYCHKCAREPQPGEEVFAEVVEKLKSANGLVIATPTYNFNIPSGLKNFIDRIGYISLDYGKKNLVGQPPGKLKHLKTYFIVSGGTPAWIRRFIFFLYPAFYLSVAFSYYYAKLGGSFYAGKLTFSTPARDDMKLLKKVRKRGNRYVKTIG